VSNAAAGVVCVCVCVPWSCCLWHGGWFVAVVLVGVDSAAGQPIKKLLALLVS